MKILRQWNKYVELASFGMYIRLVTSLLNNSLIARSILLSTYSYSVLRLFYHPPPGSRAFLEKGLEKTWRNTVLHQPILIFTRQYPNHCPLLLVRTDSIPQRKSLRNSSLLSRLTLLFILGVSAQMASEQ